ncbi:MAG TPA: glycoside hydrolase [Actinomycetota bacterium]|nr:glycoside hydrolase [Actinomycetota bacterium]
MGAAVVQARTAPPAVPDAVISGPLVTIDANAGPAIQGFGASGAWWPSDVASFSPDARAHIADLLFTSAGLDLSMFRFEIGSGGKGVTDPARAPESFAVKPGVYDWTRDPAGEMFLQMASARGVPALVGFVVSPPTFWTTNGKACGGNLKPGSEEAFAGYIADVVAHLHDQGITLSYVSPMNEPDSTFWQCTQEGAGVPAWQRPRVLSDLVDALADRAPYAHVIADESSHVQSELLPNLGSWLTQSNASQVAAIATHLYDYPSDTTFAKAAAAAASLNVPIWASEICCYNGSGFGAGYDPTMTSGLWLADTIWQALGPGNGSSFSWWTALSSAVGCDVHSSSTCAAMPNASGWNDGLLYYDPNFRANGDQAVSFTKRFWVLANFSRFVRPGAVRHTLTGVPAGVRALAFSNGRTWTIVAINDGNATTPFNVRIPSSSRYSVHAYRTSATEDLVGAAGARISRARQALASTLAPRSVTTFVLTRK